MRIDLREADELRPVEIIPDFTKTAGGSVLIRWGDTHVLCTALLEDGTMPFLRDTGRGWLTAEYAMLPSSTGGRKKRGSDGRATEIQRLIGRSLRETVDMALLGEHVIYVDCDVLQADGGTRTASITGANVAVRLGVRRWLMEGRLTQDPLVHSVAAVSVGIVDDEPLLDLRYAEDSRAQVDMNIVMNENSDMIELQGTGEGRAFSRGELDRLLALGEKGIKDLRLAQEHALALR